MGFGISTLRRTISALVIAVVLLVGMGAEALAKKGGKHGRNRADRGRHLGWTIGRHRGWDRRDDNRDRRDRRRALRRHWREERRELREHQRSERRDFRNRRQWWRN